ncbi:unnamed protein product, partial [marine sediment metagenome]
VNKTKMKKLIKLIEEKILREKMTLKKSIKYILELKLEIKGFKNSGEK